MKKLSLQQMIIAGSAAAVVVLGGGWFGLSAYASSVAEERIVSALAQLGIERSSYRWSSISASPLGGVIEINELAVNHDTSGGRGSRFATVNVDRLVLEGFNTDELPEEASITLEQVDIPPVIISDYERNTLKREIDDSLLMRLATASGRTRLEPFDLQLEWALDDDELELTWQTEQPELLRANGRQLITGQLSQLRAMTTGANLNTTEPLYLFSQLMQLIDGLGLQEAEIKVEDLGSIDRASRLRARYDIAHGRAEDEDSSKEQFIASTRSGCEKQIQAMFVNDDACERIAEFLSAERSSLTFTAEGDHALTLAELFRLDRRRPDYVKNTFNPEIN